MYDLLVKNGKLVTPDCIYETDIAIKEGKIAAVLEPGIELEAMKVIDAQGKYVFPGAIDTHAHLNDPGYEWREDYEHGTAAAAVGGYTTVIDMPLQNEPAMTNAGIMDKKLAKVGTNAYTDYCFWGGLIPDNFDDLKELDKKGCVSFKSFIGPVSPDYSSLNYGQAYEAMQIIKEFDGRVGFHCEDYSIIKWQEQRMKKEGRMNWRGFLDSRPVIAEMVATVDMIEIAKATECKIHICHVSSPDVAQKIKEAQEEGYDITAETCAHYLSLTEDDVIAKGPLFKCAPPLRTPEEVDRLWKYVEEGVFSGIASDHSPCSYDEKYNEILGNKIGNVFDVWGGISGIQSCFQVAFDEGCVKRNISPTVLAKSMAYLPAKAFGIYGKKGDIKPGFDADLVILDPQKEWEITNDSLYYVNKISAFTGKKGKGLPVLTMIRGTVVAEEGKIVAEKGYGRFVKKNK
ncbi:MAG TPA: allantoinase AllB [Lachnospiraceae bacterium]|uniref:allantoinase n=1 Tax=Muricomes intestini TaxID=1796634 RepID=A0A4R3KGZ2_9FIRM|nr:allantoinase AllB [Muricomes intestini]TCS82633.1 allantoinase [Muricomes intestini]HCR84950.1 allantoinase AllB [Lachnospiraceae bacterium]